MTDEVEKSLTGVKAEISKLDIDGKSEIAAVKVDVSTWYEKHVTAIVGVLALAIGLVLGHFITL